MLTIRIIKNSWYKLC